MISYVGKIGKAKVLVSFMHDQKCIDYSTNKPKILCYYNQNEGEVNSLDEKCSKSILSHKTRRWSLAIFFRLVDD